MSLNTKLQRHAHVRSRAKDFALYITIGIAFIALGFAVVYI
jgi:hypothetical protein